MANGKWKSDSQGAKGVPKAVVYRLSLYLRELQRLIRGGDTMASSGKLGKLLGLTDAQVRKDLAIFGQFGHPGVGYRCEDLVGAIKGILGTDREWTVAMIGAGNLGRALLGYRGFASQGFRVAAVFDADPAKIGQSLEGLVVEDVERLSEVVREREISLGLIAAPAEAAQEAATRLAAAGVVGILNFAPVTLHSLPVEVSQVSVDLATELEQLSFAVANRPETR
ncbi:Redox-sensing transcriptional repressor Rex [Pseudobythopirellula maris]|uniref:Redox-sensing transcriptional repressor Rex n=1 Tax=Pseudobythopirellula maris TaxID=2527991 RepID=A0A5C5ZMG3_9BACT|nr:redox-sensing transcriptional repressor Rex [Pseudobythopirellula maris]TWT88599.1 Redox-sensing transcriptional repressor Rex [Pseudobythopirellula maris]